MDEGAASDGLLHFDSGLVLGELDLHGGIFWEEAARFSTEAHLDALVASVQAKRTPPRIWAFLDTPESTASRAAAALATARALARPGRKILVVDGDDQRPDLTRWADRYELEGWIDFLRYGASLPACSVPLPWNGADGRFLGVGSFCPAQATPQEIWDLLARLRHRVDDILISVPLDEAGGPWLAGADVRLLCWDGLTSSLAEAERTAGELATAGFPVFGLVAFAGAVAAAETPAEKLAGEEPADVELAGVGSAAEEPAGEEPAGAPVLGSLADEVAPLGTEPLFLNGPGAAHEQAEGTEGESVAALAGAGEEPVRETSETDLVAAMSRLDESGGEGEGGRSGKRRSSPLFWGAAALLLVVIAVVGYALIHNWNLQRPDRAIRVAHDRQAMDISPPVSDLEYPPDRDEVTGQESPAQPDATLDEAAEEADSTAGQPTVPEDLLAAGPPPSPEGWSEQETTAEAGGAVSTGEPSSEQLSPEEQAEFWASFEMPVGQEGWTLWVYSLPDSATALREVAILERQGIRAAIHGVDIPDKGRWYRVYMGSFPSRAAAREAMPVLLTRLRQDWAQPVRF
jgi:cell division septation protein DedD